MERNVRCSTGRLGTRLIASRGNDDYMIIKDICDDLAN